MFVPLHVNSAARKYDAFLFQPQPLLERGVSAEQDASVGADNAMPRYIGRARVQRPRHLARRAVVTGRSRNRAVCCNAPARDFPNDRQHLFLHEVRSSSILLDMPLPHDVTVFSTSFANVYFIGEPDAWVLVDAGLPGYAGRIQRAAEARFGQRAKPRAIVLTHGHRDHAGSAAELAAMWEAPVLVHPLELPYVTGRSEYAPKDPTVGGAMALLSRFFPMPTFDLGDVAGTLPSSRSIPGLPNWLWLHTPGHTHGHVSLFRESDRTLIAGDALATMNLNSFVGIVSRRPEFAGPPAPFTPDWYMAEASLHALAGLQPNAVCAGHGLPITGEDTAERLHHFADRFRPPRKGRYVQTPARADASGIVGVPPAPPDRAPKIAAGLAVAGIAGAALMRGRRKMRSDSGAQ